MPTAIDLFAGLGGWSTGARAAGVQVLWAVNHWPEAVRYRATSANHGDQGGEHLGLTLPRCPKISPMAQPATGSTSRDEPGNPLTFSPSP